MKRFLLIGLFALVACAGAPDTRANDALAIACDTYATVLDQLTPLRSAGKLSAATVARVDAANKKVTPICGTGSSVDPGAVVGTVTSAIALLKTIKEGF